MGKAIYLAREGEFYTDWCFEELKAFPTKKALREHMKEKMGFGFSKSKEDFHKHGDFYLNKTKEYGYEIITVVKEG